MSNEDKQLLLKEEIYDKGYDLEQCSAYMDTIKMNGGSDIDVWEIGELKAAIIQYQQIEDQKKQLQQLITKPEEDNNNFSKEIECSIIQPIPDMTISIDNFQKVETGMFSFTQSYVLYTITTIPVDWSVQRRYSDFEWLREMLIKQYPGLCIPPNANKTTTRQYEDSYLVKRQKFLERFLRGINRHPVLRHDRYFLDFLRIKDEKEFKALITSTQKIPKTTKLDKLITATGVQQLIINDQVNDFHKHETTLLNNFMQAYEKIRKHSKQLQTDFDSAANTLFALGETFAGLYQSVNIFNGSVQVGQNLELEALMITLNNMMTLWGKSTSKQSEFIQEDLLNFFKFQDQEANQMIQQIRLREQAQQEFVKYKQRLDLKKDKLFLEQVTARWEIAKETMEELKNQNQLSNRKLCLQLMLPKETQQQQDLRDTYAFYNYSIFQELQRVHQDALKLYSSHFISFANHQTEELTKVQIMDNQMHMQWAEITSNLECLDQNIQNENKRTIMTKT